MWLQEQHRGVWLGTVVLMLATVCLGQINRCFSNEQQVRPNPTFSHGIEEFGLSVFRGLADQNEGSLFVSPYSLWSVLTLAYYGSEGRTRRQLEQALNLSSKSGTYTNWKLVEFLLQSNQKAEQGAKFKSLNRGYFAKDIILQPCLTKILFNNLRKVDYTRGNTAKDIINMDVNRTTEGKIENFLQSVPSDTRLVLINAVYFKGLWASPFQPEETRQQEFLIPPGVSGGNVQMMVQRSSFNHGYAPNLAASVLELPYQDSDTSMFILLPDTLDTDTVIRRLDRDTFLEAVSLMTTKKVEVVLPRFKLTTRLEKELQTTFGLMGITDLFNRGAANLTSFTLMENLFADKAIHEATVEVTEEGTVAAAASGIIITRFGGNLVHFVCNRPFIFLITNKKTGITLFAGKLVNPADIKTL